ncbi:MAG: methyl-accepting chemotaxis protein [Desulfuromonadaceae bacterium]|nr:methyl-accepting chemotaxis protein [Desulfuromonadaceae bacterium]MDD2850072.1 methyl-accepting chemotaxis protein [Desulfuromonadaceae bacterium]MDD4131860.1 methyl-accepting chemotaxis protein [Desulfuromonadaceae bacterium]
MQFRSIKTKLSVAIVLIIVVSLNVFGAASYWNAKKIIIQEMENNLQDMSKDNAQKLGMWIAERKSEMSFLANSPLVTDGTAETALGYLRNESKRDSLFFSYMMMDAKGDATFTTGEKINVAGREYFKQIMAGKAFVSDPVISKAEGKVVVVVAAPSPRNGVIIGGVAGGVPLEDMSKLIGEIKAGDTGYAYAVRSDGLIIIHPNKDMAMKINGLTDVATPPALKEITARMVKGEQGVAQYSFKGDVKYIAYAPIPGTTWSLAVNVPAKEVLAKLNALLWTSLAIILGVLVLAIAISLYIAGSITKPLESMKSMLQDIAQGEGDLTKRLDASSKDELGEASRCFNLFADKLQGLIRRVAETTEKVASASVQLRLNSERIATGAEEVAAQALTVATAGEEMAATSGDIAQNCSLAAGGSQQASAAAVSGAQVVDETIRVMNSIAERVRTTAQSVENLGSRSEQIGEIIGTIEDIADQTNLLALNAAIEAARAGEHGRGFAVVADEVRALAERTTKATKEIGAMIRTIQHETQTAVKAMEIGVGEVARGSEKAADSGRALEKILEQINDVTMQINQVATAAEEQTATTAEISNNMHQITDVVAATSRGAQDSAASANQLSGLADELRSVVGQFKL